MSKAPAEALSLIKKTLVVLTDRELVETDRGKVSLASLYLRCAEEVLTGQHGGGEVASIVKGD